MRVLLIDDDAAVRKVIRLMLESAGFEVAEAGDGAAGIREYRHHLADVVLCDLFMPDRDGLEVIQELRRNFPDVKVIAMSGGGFNGTMDMLPTARLLGATAILHKPFTQQEVLATILEALQAPVAEPPPKQNQHERRSLSQGLVRHPLPNVLASLSTWCGDICRRLAY